MNQKGSKNNILLKIFQGALIGLGAILPGISGGVLSVIFGIYRPIMELLSHPRKNVRTHLPALFPVIIGMGIGFAGIANLLSFFLEKYPYPSVCLFVGLIIGMFPSLKREAFKDGKSRYYKLCFFLSLFLVLGILLILRLTQLSLSPNFGWYLFCGFCLALSIIAPGMSFSALLMPLGLYTPFVEGIGHFRMAVLLPGALGTVITIICLSRAVNTLFEKHYCSSFCAILGIITAATIMTLPYEDFFHSVPQAFINLAMLLIGIVLALILDHYQSKVEVT